MKLGVSVLAAIVVAALAGEIRQHNLHFAVRLLTALGSSLGLHWELDRLIRPPAVLFRLRPNIGLNIGKSGIKE
jgi:hypothetical protein